MKLRLIFINTLIFICVLLSAFSIQAQSATGSQTAAEWKRYELGKGAFSVLLPVKPVEEFKSSTNPVAPVSMYTYASPTQDGAYVAQYNILGEDAENWSQATIEAYYKGVWDGVASTLNAGMESRNLPARATLVEKRKIKFSGYDGREVIFTLGKLKGRIQMTVVGRHAFAAMAMGAESMTEADQERFFSSFIIKTSPASQTAR